MANYAATVVRERTADLKQHDWGRDVSAIKTCAHTCPHLQASKHRIKLARGGGGGGGGGGYRVHTHSHCQLQAK